MEVKKNLFGLVTFSSARLINSMSACIWRYFLRLHHLLSSKCAKVVSSYGAEAQELVWLTYFCRLGSDNRVDRKIHASCSLYHGNNNKGHRCCNQPYQNICSSISQCHSFDRCKRFLFGFYFLNLPLSSNKKKK